MPPCQVPLPESLSAPILTEIRALYDPFGVDVPLNLDITHSLTEIREVVLVSFCQEWNPWQVLLWNLSLPHRLTGLGGLFFLCKGSFLPTLLTQTRWGLAAALSVCVTLFRPVVALAAFSGRVTICMA